MMKFMINNRTDTWKPNINWYDFTNCHIVHSHLLTYFVCLLSIKIGQWACKNFCSYHNMHSGSLKWWPFCYNFSKHLTGILFDDAYTTQEANTYWSNGLKQTLPVVLLTFLFPLIMIQKIYMYHSQNIVMFCYVTLNSPIYYM